MIDKGDKSHTSFEAGDQTMNTSWSHPNPNFEATNLRSRKDERGEGEARNENKEPK